MKDKQGTILYIGKANSLRKRLQQYFLPGKDTRPTIALLLSQLDSIQTIVVSSEKEALLLENTLIKKHKPKCNILLKDDKNYISLALDLRDSWPKFTFCRFKKKSPNQDLLYFGPYTSGKSAKHTFELMTKLFPLRQCSNEEFKRRTRPCILYDIKRCLGPCAQKCSKEEYTRFVEGAIDFLRGDNKKVIQTLTKEMESAAKELSFEKAAALLRTIRQIEHVTQDHPIFSSLQQQDTDAIGLYREGDKIQLSCLQFREGALVGAEPFFFESSLESDEELLSSFLLQKYRFSSPLPKELLLPFPLLNQKDLTSLIQEASNTAFSLHYPKKGTKHDLVLLAEKNAKSAFAQHLSTANSLEKILSDLQEICDLRSYPKVIECYDISHLSGSNPVGSVVVFIDGKEDRKSARRYHMKELEKQQDDYAAMRQLLMRRLLRGKETGEFPDLLLVDGGKGQLHVAEEVLKELDLIHIEVLSLVKEKGRHDKGLSQERICSLHHKDPISLSPHSPLLFLLQRVRDRAHDTAISFQKETRKKKMFTSQLETIVGIGPKKKKSLLQYFGSWKQVMEAAEKTPEKLDAISGLSQKDKNALIDHAKSRNS